MGSPLQLVNLEKICFDLGVTETTPRLKLEYLSEFASISGSASGMD